MFFARRSDRAPVEGKYEIRRRRHSCSSFRTGSEEEETAAADSLILLALSLSEFEFRTLLVGYLRS